MVSLGLPGYFFTMDLNVAKLVVAYVASAAYRTCASSANLESSRTPSQNAAIGRQRRVQTFRVLSVTNGLRVLAGGYEGLGTSCPIVLSRLVPILGFFYQAVQLVVPARRE